MIHLDGKKITGVYHGGVKIKEAYFGSEKVFTAYPKLTFEDQFNSQVLSSWWVENTGIAFNGSYIRCSNQKSATTAEYLSTGTDVAETDLWRVDIQLADIPDPVQESSVVIGPDRQNGFIVSFAPNRVWIGTRANGVDTVVASTTSPGLTASTLLSFSRTPSGFALASDRITLFMPDNNKFRGAGNRRMGIIQRVFRGGPFNAYYYYSPGIDSVSVTTTG